MFNFCFYTLVCFVFFLPYLVLILYQSEGKTLQVLTIEIRNLKHVLLTLQKYLQKLINKLLFIKLTFQKEFGKIKLSYLLLQK